MTGQARVSFYIANFALGEKPNNNINICIRTHVYVFVCVCVYNNKFYKTK